MIDVILKHLKEIEEKENVKIILAVESGSRAWNFASVDSDYDVRFIYIRNKNDYLLVNEKRDVIEYLLNDTLDINGWDLKKALKLAYNSNPVLLEWFNSPIIYYKNEFSDELKVLCESYMKVKSEVYHYYNMALITYNKYLNNKDYVIPKKYFYVLRPILAALWVIEENTAPPVLFDILVKEKLDKPLFNIVDRLLLIKKSGIESDKINKIDCLDKYINTKLFELKKYADSIDLKRKNIDEINDLFLKGVNYFDKR